MGPLRTDWVLQAKVGLFDVLTAEKRTSIWFSYAREVSSVVRPTLPNRLSSTYRRPFMHFLHWVRYRWAVCKGTNCQPWSYRSTLPSKLCLTSRSFPVPFSFPFACRTQPETCRLLLYFLSYFSHQRPSSSAPFGEKLSAEAQDAQSEANTKRWVESLVIPVRRPFPLTHT